MYKPAAGQTGKMGIHLSVAKDWMIFPLVQLWYLLTTLS